MTYRMLKTCDECEGREEGAGPLSLQDTIWRAQLENFREIVINGEIDGKVIEKVVLQIQNINRYDARLEAEARNYVREPITVYINSPGGLLSESMSIADAILVSKTPVQTVALGSADSGGFLILIAGHRRYAQIHSRVMYHQGMGGYIGKFQDYQEHAEYLERIQEMIHRYVSQRTAITREELEINRTRKHDWFFTLEELLEKRVIHGIWGLEESEEDLSDQSESSDPSDKPCDDCDSICDGCIYFEKGGQTSPC